MNRKLAIILVVAIFLVLLAIFGILAVKGYIPGISPKKTNTQNNNQTSEESNENKEEQNEETEEPEEGQTGPVSLQSEKGVTLKITSPLPNSNVTSPFEITGEAPENWFFEGVFPVQLTNESGTTFASGLAHTQGSASQGYIPFKTTFTFTVSANKKGFVVLSKDNPSGVPENADKLSIPVTFQAAQNMTIKVFLGSTTKDPDASHCDVTYAVNRTIPKTNAVGAAAINELLKGPTTSEKNNGYFTAINTGTKLNSLVIENGVARADFDAKLGEGVGGSCKTMEIISQITSTLKQFSSVKSVVISINGQSENILQP